MRNICRQLQLPLLLYFFVLMQIGLAEEDSSAEKAVAIIHDGDTMFLKVGEKRVVFCKGSAEDKSWLDPHGVRVQGSGPSRRVHAERTSVGVVLMFSYADLIDNGTWTCSSPIANASINIFIVDEAKFEGMSDVMELIEDTALHLHCRASGEPKPKLMWYKDGKPLAESQDSRVKMTGEGRVKIDRVQRDDSGEYECKALQQISTVYFAAPNFIVNVHVMHVPIMAHEKVTEEFVIMNETKVLRCAATGYPPPEYKWSRQPASGRTWTQQVNEGVDIDPEGAYSELTLKIRSEEDLQMTYTCTASNKRGTSKVQFHLQLGNKPPMLSKVELVGATNESLEFLVECDNCTSPERDAIVSPNSTDLPVTQYRFELLNTTNETVDWEAVTAEITVVTLDRNLTHNTYVVDGLQPETTYQVRAAAVNLAGLSEFLNLPPALTAATGPTSPQSWLYPTLVTVLALSRHHVL